MVQNDYNTVAVQHSLLLSPYDSESLLYVTDFFSVEQTKITKETGSAIFQVSSCLKVIKKGSAAESIWSAGRGDVPLLLMVSSSL